MSTHYSFYLFAKRDKNRGFLQDNFIYCGPYDKEGIPAALNGVSSHQSFIIRSLAFYLDEDSEVTQNVFKCLGIKLQNANIFKKGAYYVALEDLTDIKDTSHKQAYVHKNIIRDMEINHLDFDLTEMMYSHQGEDDIICESEYAQLSQEEKKNYIFHHWVDEDDETRLKDSFQASALGWFHENIAYCKEFEGIDYENLYFVIPL